MQERRAPGRRAFTLVEMLVVVFVIAILVTIVVGVSKVVISRAAKDRTIINMKVILGAVDAYHELTGSYPSNPDWVRDPATFPVPVKPAVGWTDRDWVAYQRGKHLYGQLDAIPQAQAKLSPLGKDAILSISGSSVFVDGFRKYMAYFRDQGAGGTPLVVSAGADGDFGTPEDNIRSDDR